MHHWHRRKPNRARCPQHSVANVVARKGKRKAQRNKITGEVRPPHDGSGRAECWVPIPIPNQNRNFRLIFFLPMKKWIGPHQAAIKLTLSPARFRFFINVAGSHQTNTKCFVDEGTPHHSTIVIVPSWSLGPSNSSSHGSHHATGHADCWIHPQSMRARCCPHRRVAREAICDPKCQYKPFQIGEGIPNRA